MSVLLGEFLAAADLDDLADVSVQLGVLSDRDRQVLETVLAGFDDTQAVANILMYPKLVPVEQRAAVLLRGLSAPSTSYLRLAAAVGAGDLSDFGYVSELRPALVEALLDLVADNDGVVASRAATSVGALLRVEDAAEVIELLEHPDVVVRRNLHIALLELLGTAGFDDLLEDRQAVSAEMAERVRRQLREDGRLEQPMTDLQRMPLFAWIPNYCDWTAPPSD